MAMASHGELTYNESLRRALNIEAAMSKEDATVSAPLPPRHQHDSRNKRKWDGDRPSYDCKRQESFRNPGHYGGRQDVPDQRSEYRPKIPLCAKCSRNHFGECKAGTGRCYNYGGSGHFSKECPNKKTGMDVRPNYQGPHPQLQALEVELKEDVDQPPYQYQYHGYEEDAMKWDDDKEK